MLCQIFITYIVKQMDAFGRGTAVKIKYWANQILINKSLTSYTDLCLEAICPGELPQIVLRTCMMACHCLIRDKTDAYEISELSAISELQKSRNCVQCGEWSS